MPELVYLDAVVGEHIKGWAYDPTAPDRPVKVQILVDGVPLGGVMARENRQDLGKKGFAHTRVGFRLKLPAGYLDGSRHEFAAQAEGGGDFRRSLVTTSPAFPAAEDRPWYDRVDPRGAPEPEQPERGRRTTRDLRRLLALFRENRVDEAVGIARRVFRANRELFTVDVGIVDAVRTHTGVKSFQQIIAGRTEDWFTAPNRSVWQRRLVIKSEMRNFALRNEVALPRLYASFSRPEELLRLELPERYVAKPDDLASARGVFAVAEGINVFTGRPVSPKQIVTHWRRLAASTGRAQAFMVEELLSDRFAPQADVIPLDYKIYVFGGTAGFVEVFDRNFPRPSRTPYSLAWRPLPHPLQTRSQVGPAIRRPDNLDEMIDIAERLGRDFGYFCRVDMFNTPTGPMLGEITVLPANGKNRTPYADRLTQQAFIVFEDREQWAAEVTVKDST